MDSLFTPTVTVEALKPGMVIRAPEHHGEPRTIAGISHMADFVTVTYRDGLGGRTFPYNTQVEVIP